MNIDFIQARFKHLNWRFKLRNFLDGKETMTEAQALSHYDCDLGKWWYAVGKAKYGDFPEAQKFEIAHEQLHNLIKNIVALKKSGKIEESEEEYSKVAGVSKIIIDMLDEIEKKVKV
jgi:methyl-accepting chemotaxis protein